MWISKNTLNMQHCPFSPKGILPGRGGGGVGGWGEKEARIKSRKK